MPFLFVMVSLLVSTAFAYGLYKLAWISIPDEKRRIGYIDGIRGFLALAVMFHHFFVWQKFLDGGVWESPSSNLFNNFGQAGVLLFFMITGNLFYLKISVGLRKVDWISLYISRLFRLTPLMWGITLLVIFTVLFQTGFVFPREPTHSIRAIAHWLTFTGDPDILGFSNTWRIIAGVTWSLRYEWHFYLILPVVSILFMFFGRYMSKILMLCLFLSIALFFIKAHFTAYLQDVIYIPLFLIGMISAELRSRENVVRLCRTTIASFIGLTAIVVELLGFHAAYGFTQYFLLGLFFIPIALGNSYFNILNKAWSLVLGELSYGIYLFHGFVLYVFMSGMIFPTEKLHGMHEWIWVILPVIALLVVACSAVAHRLIEVPGIALGRRISGWVKTLDIPGRVGFLKRPLAKPDDRS
jgi:peptidoglycan/LPS O-acetylase OafA/YrhL